MSLGGLFSQHEGNALKLYKVITFPYNQLADSSSFSEDYNLPYNCFLVAIGQNNNFVNQQISAVGVLLWEEVHAVVNTLDSNRSLFNWQTSSSVPNYYYSPLMGVDGLGKTSNTFGLRVWANPTTHNVKFSPETTTLEDKSWLGQVYCLTWGGNNLTHAHSPIAFINRLRKAVRA